MGDGRRRPALGNIDLCLAGEVREKRVEEGSGCGHIIEDSDVGKCSERGEGARPSLDFTSSS